MTAATALAASGMVAASALTPPPFHGTAGLSQVGPVDEANGFPMWYKDTNNTRLELCTDPNDALCVVGAVQSPGQPLSFPNNFPDEAFYSNVSASLDTGGGGKANLVTGIEAAFNGGPPAANDQITFGRIRVRASGPGMQAGAKYTVTHPYGTDTFDDPDARLPINNTQDMGDLLPGGGFDQTLGARPAPFLKWDPAVGPAAPKGYLGDPTQDHPIVGAVTADGGANIFRIQGPPGSFNGSSQLCPGTTDGSCIQTNLFQVQGKLATRAGVQVSSATFSDDANGGNDIDLTAFSTPGQKIAVTGTGIGQVVMRGDANGRYFARVQVPGAPPADLAVTNTTDAPASVAHVPQGMFGDKVHVNSAAYDAGTSTLTVTAQSGVATSSLSLDGFSGPNVTTTPGQNGSPTSFRVTGVAVPPDNVVVKSNQGGVASSDVVITGDPFSADALNAVITGDTSVEANVPLSLDASQSSGAITAYTWTVSAGGTITPSPAQPGQLAGLGATFKAGTPGTYTVTLKVTGAAGATKSATQKITVVGAAAAPVADAGPAQTALPTSTVTLDGTASQFAATYNWTAPAGITLTGGNTANPTFVAPVPAAPTTYTFKLQVADSGGQLSNVASTTVSVTPDSIAAGTLTTTYRTGAAEWRIRGNLNDPNYCSANNLYTFTWNKPGAAGAAPTPLTIGTATPTLALGVCSFDFRVKNTPSNLRPTAAAPGTVTIKSALGTNVVNAPISIQ